MSVGTADHQKGGKQGRDDHVKHLSTQTPLQRSFSIFAKCFSARIWIKDLFSQSTYVHGGSHSGCPAECHYSQQLISNTKQLLSRSKHFVFHSKQLVSLTKQLFSHTKQLFSHTKQLFSHTKQLFSHTKQLFSHTKQLLLQQM